MPPTTNANDIGNRKNCLGEAWRTYGDYERTTFKTHYFQDFTTSVADNCNDFVLRKDSWNLDSKDNEISLLVPSEVEALFQPLYDKLFDT